MNKRLIRDDAINILVEHGVSPFNATHIIDACISKGRLTDQCTELALLLPEGSDRDFEIVDVGTYEKVETVINRTPRRKGHLKLVS